MSVPCGYEWDDHECFAAEEHEEYVSEYHVCKCGASIHCRQAARQDELRKEADANWRHYGNEGGSDVA